MAEKAKYVEGPRIDLAAAKGAADAGTAVFIDVRGREAFERSRIPGARWLMLRALMAGGVALPKERASIFY